MCNKGGVIMNIGFSQTAEHHLCGTLPHPFSDALIKAIQSHSGWQYSCTQTTDGYYLKPTFRNMPYRNSFVPEITIDLSEHNGQTTLVLTGQPIAPVRIFMWVWLSFTATMQVLLLALMLLSGKFQLIPSLIPSIMILFGYLLCKLATRFTFRSVVAAIVKTFP
jgi:hypothetical protein